MTSAATDTKDIDPEALEEALEESQVPEKVEIEDTDLKAQIATLQRALEEERAKTAPKTEAYVELSVQINAPPHKVTNPDDPVLIGWETKGRVVCYVEYKDGQLVRCSQKRAGRARELLRRYKMEGATL